MKFRAEMVHKNTYKFCMEKNYCTQLQIWQDCPIMCNKYNIVITRTNGNQAHNWFTSKL
jgi:hypothetical protein